MGPVVLLSDRAAAQVLPALSLLDLDLKMEPPRGASLRRIEALAPAAVVVDVDPGSEGIHRLLRSLAAGPRRFGLAIVVARDDLERSPWTEVADELLFGDMSPAEVRVRLEMLARRTGGGGEGVLRLGPLAMDTDTYRVLVAGRVLDLTYREFELMRFLLQSPGRVFSRGTLLRQVWGYDSYGGTRTVDVHVRRLRAKLGPEHEALIGTVRGVGYLARPPDEQAGPPPPD